jgi:hypothetical protein
MPKIQNLQSRFYIAGTPTEFWKILFFQKKAQYELCLYSVLLCYADCFALSVANCSSSCAICVGNAHAVSSTNAL